MTARLEALWEELPADLRSIPTITATSLSSLLSSRDSRGPILVDCRPSQERKVSCIPGSISETEFLTFHSGHPEDSPDHEPEVVLYCTIGHRSALFARKLLQSGDFKDVKNLKFGILGWVNGGFQIVADDGEGGATKRVHVYSEKWNVLPDGYEPVVHGVWGHAKGAIQHLARKIGFI